MPERQFVCERGGECCTQGLTGQAADGRVFGLYLTPEEARHFPAGTVVPLLRAGEHVFAYQVAVDRCPHIRFPDGRAVCGIYAHRPLACRAFPASVRDDGGVTINLDACPCTAKYAGAAWDPASFGDCLEAARAARQQANAAPRATAVYPLNERAWAPL